jgi:hypothetical protein
MGLPEEEGGIHWGWASVLKLRYEREGRTGKREIPVETDYHPGLDNPVAVDARCARFTLFTRPHRPDPEFEFCVQCRAPLLRPDRELS